MAKLVLGGAFVAALEQDVINFVTSLTQKHLGTTDAEAVNAVGNAVAGIVNTAENVNPASTAPAVAVESKGDTTTALDATADLAGNVVAAVAEEVAGAAAETNPPITGA